MRAHVSVLIVFAAVAAACAGDSPDARPTTENIDDATTTLTPPTTRPEPQAIVVPDVDLAISNVELADVVFDTFDGGFVTLDETDRELRERLLDVIPPIDNPQYELAADTDWLAADDLIVGFVRGDEQYAFPVRILNSHEIVNDTIGDTPVLISYCPLCRSAVVYDRRLEGNELSFSNTSALHESDLVMVDRETGSYWWQIAGTAIVGELTGSELQPLPSELASWADWVERHPASFVLSRNTGYNRRYERDNFSRYEASVAAGEIRFPLTPNAGDAILGAASIVIVLEIDDQAYAYPITELSEPFTDTLGGRTVQVTPHGVGATAQLIDAAGNATAAPSRTAFWFSILRAFPDVVVRRPE